MPFWQSAKCLVGAHVFNWKYASLSKASCLQESICSNCGKRSERVMHLFGDWESLNEDDPCYQERQCSRCEHCDQRWVHAFGEPRFVSRMNCDRESECRRCHVVVDRPPSHSFQYEYAVDWKPSNAETVMGLAVANALIKYRPHVCDQIFICTRCDRHETREDRRVHDWSPWAPVNSDESVRTCNRCGDDEFHYRD